MADHLPSPDDEKKPLILTDEQARLMLSWFALDDYGHFVNRRGIVEMAKGWGKSPLMGALAIAELAGPVLFDGWNSDGSPRAKRWGEGDTPPPLVQVAAVSEDQAENTYGAIYQFLTARNGKVAESIGVDQGRTRLYLVNRPGALHAVTASAGSREGQRLTFAVLDETHLWTRTNGGLRLADTIRRNAAKMGGRTIETTNAPTLGEKSVAERSGTAVDLGHKEIMYYARRPAVEPQPNWTDEQFEEALDQVYGDARWIDRQRLVKEIRDPSTDWSDALRYYFNVRSTGTGRAVDPRVWDALARPRDVPAGTYIGIGFDGSVSNDATVLRGCTQDGYSFLIGAWVRPKGATDWHVPRLDVHEAVHAAFARWHVGKMLCDPPYWQADIEQWQERYSEDVVLGLDTYQARRMSPAVNRWLTAIRDGSHTHDGDPITGEHVKSVQLKKVRLADADDDGRTRYMLEKAGDRRKIDGAIADVLALEAAMTMPAEDTSGPAMFIPFEE